MPAKKDLSLDLIRHQLASIDLSDIEDKKFRKDMTQAERDAYCSAIFAVWPRLEKDLKEFMHDQLLFVCNNAEDMLQVSFGRGTFNGFDFLFDYWQTAASEWESKGKEDKDEGDKNNPMPEL